MSNLKFPHALHLDPRGGAAQMGRRLSARHGFGQQLVCADCHVPTPDGVRFQPPDMEDDCGMCHSLAFDQLGGTIRTLRHGSPEQVIGDIRSLFRAGGPQRPAALATARTRPGDVARIQAALQTVPGVEVCGVAYDGVGIPAVIASGRAAATRVIDALAPAATMGT